MFQVTISDLPASYISTLTLNYTILILYLLLCMGVKLGILPYMKCSKGEELTGDSFI